MMRARLLLTLTTFSLIGTQAARGQQVVRPGESMEGVLEASDTTATAGQVARLVPLEAPAGTRLSVVLESTEFDAYAALVVLDETGGFTAIDENDDAPGLAGDTDARVRGLIQPDRSYALWVGSYDGAGTGAFRLTAESAPEGEVFPVPVPLGTEIHQVLDEEDPVDPQGRPFEVYTVEVGALSRIMAFADGQAAPTLRLETEDGAGTLAESVDVGDRMLLDQTVENAGRYRIVVTANGVRGPYRLRAWVPGLTLAEQAGLAAGDSLLRNEELGFHLPRPDAGYAFTRGFTDAWGRDLVGDYRLWLLQDAEAERQIMIIWYRTLGALDPGTFEAEVAGIAAGAGSGFAAGTPIRSKPASGDAMEYRASIRPVDGDQASSIRCIGRPGGEEVRGRFLCVVVWAEAVYPEGERILDGMVIR